MPQNSVGGADGDRPLLLPAEGANPDTTAGGGGGSTGTSAGGLISKGLALLARMPTMAAHAAGGGGFGAGAASVRVPARAASVNKGAPKWRRALTNLRHGFGEPTNNADGNDDAPLALAGAPAAASAAPADGGGGSRSGRGSFFSRDAGPAPAAGERVAAAAAPTELRPALRRAMTTASPAQYAPA